MIDIEIYDAELVSPVPDSKSNQATAIFKLGHLGIETGQYLPPVVSQFENNRP
jgi:hypothetical protein